MIDEASLRAIIDSVWSDIQPSGTLQEWLPYHPLKPFEGLTITHALQEYYESVLATDAQQIIAQINKLTLQWVPRYFDDHQTFWPLPERDDNLGHSILRLYVYHSSEKPLIQQALAMSSIDIIALCLQHTGFVKEVAHKFLWRLLQTLPGVASFVRYQSIKKNLPQWQIDFLALRCLWALEYQLDAQSFIDATISTTFIDKAWQHVLQNEAEQKHIIDTVCQTLPPQPSEAVIAHMVFCIDTRSGPIRHLIEQFPYYSTDGLAGFFGLDIALTDSFGTSTLSLCPAILSPTVIIQAKERPMSLWHRCYHQIVSIEAQIKKTPLAMVLWIEVIGVVYGLWMLLLSLGLWRKSQSNATQTALVLDNQAYQQIERSKRLSYAKNFLTALHCRNKLPPFVIICGHGSSTLNNLFAAKLQCGACGNYRGSNNARLMAQILNDRHVQHDLLTDEKLCLKDTVFIAAEHDTTDDSITFYDIPQALKAHPIWLRITNDLQRVSRQNYDKRAQLLRTQRLSPYHWAAVRPEWGLAGHQAFLIGPHWWGAHLLQSGQAFSHSYNDRDDNDGAVLAGIFQGPLTVAFLLSMPYLLGSFDSALFAAGNKMLHQLSVGSMVMQGCGSDFLIGLPEQAIHIQSGKLYHRPQRLMLLVYSSRYKVRKVLLSQPSLLAKIVNGWLRMMVYDPILNRWFETADLLAATHITPTGVEA